MPQRLLDVLSVGHCSHEFSWPRRSPDGHYYQICMLCASQYKYDWTTMRRTERVQHSAEEVAAASQTAESPHKPVWVPRARRLKLAVPLRYRAKSAPAWIQGRVTNLSQSGLLFLGPQSLPANALLEMMFHMPEEISGQEKAKVLCQGRVIRCKSRKSKAEKGESNEKEESNELAVSILDYRFLPRG